MKFMIKAFSEITIITGREHFFKCRLFPEKAADSG